MLYVFLQSEQLSARAMRHMSHMRCGTCAYLVLCKLTSLAIGSTLSLLIVTMCTTSYRCKKHANTCDTQ